jgi:formate/nitrite transporter FocA (FNT family)
LLIFAGIHSGGAYGFGDWLPWFGWVLLGNLVGGIGLTTVLRLVRSQDRIKEWRQD